MQILNLLRNDYVDLDKKDFFDFLNNYSPNREINYTVVRNLANKDVVKLK